MNITNRNQLYKLCKFIKKNIFREVSNQIKIKKCMYVILLEHNNYAPLTCSPGMSSYISVCMYVFINLHFGEHACKNTGTKV